MCCDDLVGKSIVDITSADSHKAIHQAIQDLVAAETKERENQGENRRMDEGVYSGNSSNEDNAVVSRSSDHSFPLYEVNVNEHEDIGYLTYSSGNGTSKNESSSDQSNSHSSTPKLRHRPSSLTTDANFASKTKTQEPYDRTAPESATDNAQERTNNDTKTEEHDKDSRLRSQHALTRTDQKQDSMSSTDDSRNRDSNESSSDGYAEDQGSSSVSGESSWKKG